MTGTRNRAYLRIMTAAVLLAAIVFSQTGLHALHKTTGDVPGAGQEDNDFYCSLAVDTGMSYGALGEYVYTSTKKLSELNWDVKPVFTAGLSLSAVMGRHLFLGFAWQTGYTRKSGIMEDSDWQAGDPGIKTNYSRSSSVTDSLHETDLNAGFVFALNDRAVISFHGGYQFKYFQMAAWDGYLQYDTEPYNDYYWNYDKVPMYGLVMRYRQAWHIPYASLDGKLTIFDGVSLFVSFAFSPAVFCRALDNHLLMSDDYYDSMNWGKYFSFQAGVSWEMAPRLVLSLSLQYEYVPVFKGESIRIDTATGNSSYLGSDVAGASLSMARIQASLTLLLCLFD